MLLWTIKRMTIFTLRRKKNHEVFYNMRLYALLDMESFTLKEFVDIINKRGISINTFKKELHIACGKEFDKKLKYDNKKNENKLHILFHKLVG